MVWWRRRKPKRDYDEIIDGPLVDAYMDIYNLKLQAESDINLFKGVADASVPNIHAEKAKVLANREVSTPTGNYFEDQATIEQWQFVLTYDPTNINAYLSIGEILLAHKQKRIARKCFEKVLQLDSDNEHAKRRLNEI